MLPNIKRHSIVVAKVALQVLDGFSNNVADEIALPDQNLVVAGALLHDIAKTPCLEGDCDHAVVGSEICNQLGYKAVAPIVAEHVVLSDHNPNRYAQGIFSAVEIIYYADKRVRHEEIVSLYDRLEYILENYGMGDPGLHRMINENFQKCIQLESHLFSFIDFSPEEVAAKVWNNMFERQPELCEAENGEAAA